MRLYDRHPLVPLGLPEIVEARTVRSKTFNLGGNKRKLVMLPQRIHWRNGQVLEDVDLSLAVQPDGMLRMDQADYKLIVDPTTATLRHESRKSGARARVGLKAIGGQPAVLAKPIVEDGRIRWLSVVPGVDIELWLRPRGAEWFKVIHGPDAPHEFTWTVERQEGFDEAKINLETRGLDANKDRLRIAHQLGAVRVAGGWIKSDFTERFERQVSRVADKRTRRREWANDPQYPVWVDQDISETTAFADHGYDTPFGGWFSSPIQGHWTGTPAFHMGLRFTTIPLGQGATIDLANLKLQHHTTNKNPVGTGATAGLFYADDVNDAAAFSGGNLPRNITKTAASTAWSFNTTTGAKTFDCTTVVQEIVDRAGWANNNDLRFAFFQTDPAVWVFTTSHLMSTAYGANPPLLEIDYTGGGPAESTGTGLLTGAATSVVGLGSVIHYGGVLQVADGSVIGAGISGSVGTAELVVAAATIVSSGISSSTGSGLLSADLTTITGVGVSGSVGTGYLAVDSFTIVSEASAFWNASGVLVVGDSSAVGTGQVAWIASGLLEAAVSSVVGVGVSGSVGTGMLAVDVAQLIGRLNFYDVLVTTDEIYTDVSDAGASVYTDITASGSDPYTDIEG